MYIYVYPASSNPIPPNCWVWLLVTPILLSPNSSLDLRLLFRCPLERNCFFFGLHHMVMRQQWMIGRAIYAPVSSNMAGWKVSHVYMIFPSKPPSIRDFQLQRLIIGG